MEVLMKSIRSWDGTSRTRMRLSLFRPARTTFIQVLIKVLTAVLIEAEGGLVGLQDAQVCFCRPCLEMSLIEVLIGILIEVLAEVLIVADYCLNRILNRSRLLS